MSNKGQKKRGMESGVPRKKRGNRSVEKWIDKTDDKYVVK